MVNKIPLIFTIQMANKRKRNTKKRNSAYNFINDNNFEISAVILFGLGIFLLLEEMEIKTYLYNGDVYQINYTQPIIFHYNQKEPLDLYMQIKEKARPKFGFYLDINDSQFLSFSPEKFFTRIQNRISSYPIKGTIKRIKDCKKETG